MSVTNLIVSFKIAKETCKIAKKDRNKAADTTTSHSAEKLLQFKRN